MTLDDWLTYQQRVHPRSIELGLDRVRAVYDPLGAPRPAPVVITIGGTNGKGSTVAFLEAMLRAGGRRVGAYTSPHLLRYNERVRIDGVDASDGALVAAFETIERARGDVALTYFEFGTLAALLLFAEANVDVALLEVGLGGRLDAVNLVDADVSVVTTIDLDHQDWLGNDRDAIGREKAGIARAGRPFVIGDADAPRGLLDEASRVGADVKLAGRDFSFDVGNDAWSWQRGATMLKLAHPALAAPCQHANASAAIAALHALRDRVAWNPDAIARGVRDARIAARLQAFASTPGLVVDVAHNPQAARVLAAWLRDHPIGGRTFAVFGALDDKDVAGIVAPLRERIDAWHLAGLDRDSPRGFSSSAIAAAVKPLVAGTSLAVGSDVDAALASAFADAGEDDRIVAFGSFFVAAAALRFAADRAFATA
jgi:dihydrofolate synthase/folylpolyglutamate synthase